ncbi:MAG: hypothetical protein QXU97_02860 [Fervidicoccaceae archaeon]
MARKILSVEPVSNAEAMSIVNSKLRETLTNVIMKRVAEYLSSTSKCGDRAGEVKRRLVELGFSAESSALLVNTLPRDQSELRALLLQQDRDIGPEKIEKALETLKLCV